MRHDRFISRAALLALSLVTALSLTCPAFGAGVDFSVDSGATGVAGSAVNTNAAVAPPGPLEAEIYLGGGALAGPNNNILRIALANLGLQAGDNVNAISIRDTASDLLDLDDPLTYNSFSWHFTVDPLAAGLPGTAVDTEAQNNEAAGDVFTSSLAGTNVLVIDEAWLGLVAPLPTEDDQDALDLEDDEGAVINPIKLIFFSLAPGSPSLSGMPGWPAGSHSPADIFWTVYGAGPVQGKAYTHTQLGLQATEDVDALFIDVWGIPLFSVAAAVPGLRNPGDILLPDGSVPFGVFDGNADVVITALQLGLQQTTDNLNGLDVLAADFDGAPDGDGDGLPDWWEGEHGVDDPVADPDDDELDNEDEYDNNTDPNDDDSDDDGLPDGWEVDNDLDPNDDTGDNGANGDPDGDGFTNQEEYDAGSDPNDRLWTPDGHFVPVTGPFTAAILAAALAAIGLKRRRR
jgi:hypothetical protein